MFKILIRAILASKIVMVNAAQSKADDTSVCKFTVDNLKKGPVNIPKENALIKLGDKPTFIDKSFKNLNNALMRMGYSTKKVWDNAESGVNGEDY